MAAGCGHPACAPASGQAARGGYPRLVSKGAAASGQPARANRQGPARKASRQRPALLPAGLAASIAGVAAPWHG
ncbi:hypothetical protein GW17_00062370, partial [Ensete ventricosum]